MHVTTTNPASTSTSNPTTSSPTTRQWPLERVLFAMAGTVTPVSAVLAAVVSRWFLLLTAFVGLNQWLYVTLRRCPASVVLKRLGVKSQCRW